MVVHVQICTLYSRVGPDHHCIDRLEPVTLVSTMMMIGFASND
jgi:hypothetical protein